MASPAYADRAQETTTTTGTGTYTLGGAATGYRTFVTAYGDAAIVEYCCTDGTDWEVGIGTVTDAGTDTLSRDEILASSNSNNAVNWSAGLKDIFGTVTGPTLERKQSILHPGRDWSRYHLGFTRTSGNSTYVKDRLHFVPYPVSERTAFNRIGIYVNSNGSASSVARLGIYESDMAGEPGDLVLDAGTTALDGAGGHQEITITQTLNPGFYFLALVHNSATNPTLKYGQSSPFSWYWGFSAVNSNAYGIYEGYTYSTLPSSAGTITYTGSFEPPGIWLRKV